jgi:acetolactate decarboxylase
MRRGLIKGMIETNATRREQTPAFQVKWAGEQRDVLSGDLAAHISLESLKGLPDLYALGPLEGLKGEVTILESTSFVSSVASGEKIAIDSSFCHGACFLAYTQVESWQEVVLPSVVLTETELEWFLPEAARGAAIDPEEPFPYLLRGIPLVVDVHILNKTDSRPHNRERHEQAKVRFQLKRKALTIIGFYSNRHRGIFTPGESSIHQHVVSKDGALAGHVDKILFSPAVRLFLPDVGR